MNDLHYSDSWMSDRQYLKSWMNDLQYWDSWMNDWQHWDNWMNDGFYWPIKADRYDDEAGKVESESPKEGHDPTCGISSLPGHSGVPTDLQWHHKESHLKDEHRGVTIVCGHTCLPLKVHELNSQ